MQRADQRIDEQLDAVAARQAVEKWLRSFRFNLNQWAGWNYGGDRLILGRQRERARGVREQLGDRRRRQRQRRRASTIAPRAAARAPTATLSAVDLGYLSERRAPAVVDRRHHLQHRPTAWARPCHDISPDVTYRPSSFLTVSGGLSFTRNHDESQWIEATTDGHYVFGRHRSEDRRPYRRGSTTPSRRVCRFRSTREPFVSAGDYSNFKELVDGRAEIVRSDRYRAIRLQPATRTSTIARSARPTCCAGSTGPARRCSSSGSRDARTRRLRHVRLQPRLRRRLRRAGQNVFLVKWAYWLNL